MKKTLLIVLGFVILLVIGVWVYFSQSHQRAPVTMPSYSLEDDYCGKQIDIHYCQCAFEGKFCVEVGIPNQEVARKTIQDNFEIWLVEKKKEQCVQEGGTWIEEGCWK